MRRPPRHSASAGALLVALTACGGAPKASDTLDAAASWTALAGEVVAERANRSLTRPFAADALGAAADGLTALGVQLDSAKDLDASTRQLAAREAGDRSADARRLAAVRGPLPGEDAKRFTESSQHFRALAAKAKDAQRKQGGGSSP